MNYKHCKPLMQYVIKKNYDMNADRTGMSKLSHAIKYYVAQIDCNTNGYHNIQTKYTKIIKVINNNKQAIYYRQLSEL